MYNLIERKDGRVVLTDDAPKDGETILQEINAKTWLQARAKVKMYLVVHNPGYGYIRR